MPGPVVTSVPPGLCHPVGMQVTRARPERVMDAPGFPWSPGPGMHGGSTLVMPHGRHAARTRRKAVLSALLLAGSAVARALRQPASPRVSLFSIFSQCGLGIASGAAGIPLAMCPRTRLREQSPACERLRALEAPITPRLRRLCRRPTVGTVTRRKSIARKKRSGAAGAGGATEDRWSDTDCENNLRFFAQNTSMMKWCPW